MAIRDLLWACPLCATPGGLRANNRGPRATHVARGGNRRGDRCGACGAEFRRELGATIIASTSGGSAGLFRMSPAQWLERLPPRDPATIPSELGPEPAVVRAAVHKQPVRQGGELIGWLDRFGPRRRGDLLLTADQLRFDTPNGAAEWPLHNITAVQPTSSKLQVAARHMPVTAIQFPGASVRLWDEAIREALRRTWHARGRGEIAEFHPRITAR